MQRSLQPWEANVAWRLLLVKRTAYATIPPKVEYELSKLGRSLIEPLKTLAGWAQRNRPAIEAARARFEAEKAEAE